MPSFLVYSEYLYWIFTFNLYNYQPGG